MLSIDKIEGNSKLGNPVFSANGRKSNYQYAVFQQSFAEKQARLDRAKVLTEQQETFNEYKKYMKNIKGENKHIGTKLKNIEEDQKRAHAKHNHTAEEQQQLQANLPSSSVNNKVSLPPKPGGALSRNRTSATVGTSGFKAISRHQYYKVHTDPNKSKIAAPGHYRPRHETVHKRSMSAKIRPAATEVSEPMAKAQAIKEYNFDTRHVCARLLRSHDQSRVSANQKAYYKQYSKSREHMKMEREGVPQQPMIKQSSSNQLQPEKSNENLISDYQEVRDSRDQLNMKPSKSQSEEQSLDRNKAGIVPSSTQSQVIAGGPNMHVFSVQKRISKVKRTVHSGRPSFANKTAVIQRRCSAKPTIGLTKSQSVRNASLKKKNQDDQNAENKLFSDDCLSLKVSNDHTLIRNFPNQEVIFHDRDHLLNLQYKKIGADVYEPSRSCKLLDFTGHLARRDRPINPKEPCAAAGGTGREFINVDELIQAQIKEGYHGLDAFTPSYSNNQTPAGGVGPKFFSSNSSQYLPLKSLNNQNSTRNSYQRLGSQPSAVDLTSPSASTQMTMLHGNKSLKKSRIKSAAAQRQGGIQIGLHRNMTNTQSNLFSTQTGQEAKAQSKTNTAVDVSFAIQNTQSQNNDYIPGIETNEFQIKVGNLDSPQDPTSRNQQQAQVVTAPPKDTTVSKRTVQFVEDTDDVIKHSESKDVSKKSALGHVIINEASEEDLQNALDSPDSPQVIEGSFRDLLPIYQEAAVPTTTAVLPPKQTRLHTLVKKVPGDVSFAHKPGRNNEFPQMKLLQPAEITASLLDKGPSNARVPHKTVPVFTPFNYAEDYLPHPILEDPAKQKKLIPFDKQVTRKNCHQKNTQLVPNLNEVNNLGKHVIMQHEVKEIDHFQKGFEKLGHVKSAKATSFSTKAKTGRDRLIKSGKDSKDPSIKGSHTGPDMIRNSQWYQNILNDNAQVGYLEQFHYQDVKKKKFYVKKSNKR